MNRTIKDWRIDGFQCEEAVIDGILCDVASDESILSSLRETYGGSGVYSLSGKKLIIAADSYFFTGSDELYEYVLSEQIVIEGRHPVSSIVVVISSKCL